MKRGIIFFLTLLTLFFHGTNAHSQALVPNAWRQLDTGEGLFNNQVRFMVNMPDGRILVFTEGMFNLYNGHHFEHLDCDLTKTYPLGMHNNCRTYDNGDGLLWAKDFYRLYLIDTHTYRFHTDIVERLAPSGVTEKLNDFIMDNDGQAWLITQSGKLYRYNWKDRASLIYSPTAQDTKKNIRVKEVIQAGSFHLIFFNNRRMLCWEEKTASIVETDDRLAQPRPSEDFRLHSIQADKKHLLIAINEERGTLYKYDIYTREWEVLLENQVINDIKKDEAGNIWLGTEHGVLCYSPELEIIQQEKTFPIAGDNHVTDHIMSVLFDHQGSLWLGTGSSGVLQYTRNNLCAIQYINPLSSTPDGHRIRALLPYDATHLLAGTLDGVYLFDTQSKTFAEFTPELRHVTCTNIKKDRRNRIWFSTRQGLMKAENGAITAYTTENVQGLTTNIFRFCQPVEDGSLWVCNGVTQLGHFYPDRRHVQYFDSLTDKLSTSRALSFMYEAGQGTMLVGSQNGFFQFTTDGKHMDEVEWLAPMQRYSRKYNCIYKDSRGNLWTGTQNGLLLHPANQQPTRRYTTQDGLSNNSIHSITEDTNGTLWVTTSRGVTRITPHPDGHYALLHIDSNDGIPESEMMEQAIACMPNGAIYAGSTTGLVEILPENIKNMKYKLKPFLVNFSIMNRPVSNDGIYNNQMLMKQGLSYTSKVTLNYNENFLDLVVSALNYRSPQHTNYRYQMKGVDKGWNHYTSPTGLCTATYTSLEPGTYTFMAQASIGYENWGDTLILSLVVKPPFWKTWWAYFLYTLLALALIYYMVDVYISYRRSRLELEQEGIKRQREQHLDELKYRFFTNISHEFRTPLTLIITPLEVLVKQTADAKLKRELGSILQSARDLLRLVNRLLDFRRLEQQGEHLSPEPVTIKIFIEECVGHFSHQAREKHIDLVCECLFGEEDIFYLDREKIIRVLNNLLSNAFKFTPEGGVITVTSEWLTNATGENTGIRLAVSDTGTGIAPEDLKNIFDRFYQSNTYNAHPSDTNRGSGIGLNLAKGYTELHHGTIEVKSVLGKGSTFTVQLPVLKQTDKTQAKLPSPDPENELSAPTDVGEATATGEPPKENITLLLVEDNTQFRHFMKETLQAHYRVLTAADGVEGLDMARTYNPDLIISDVMMPRMDGYKFCQLIKTDVKFSHIPFILLTAKNSSESRQTAYDAGADSFVAKPFNMDMMLTRIRQLIDQREKRKNKFITEITVDPKEITINSLDKQLIERAMQCMERNMDNTDYSVESLSQDIGIDRTYLYRKMQAIIGQTPSEFMRSVRLKRAARLLESSRLPVQQISFMVGFNTPRYFSSYFKDMFGVTPSQYAQMKQEQKKADPE